MGAKSWQGVYPITNSDSMKIVRAPNKSVIPETAHGTLEYGYLDRRLRMHYFLPIYRKELRRYFATPVGPVLLGASALVLTLAIRAAADDYVRYKLIGPVL